MTSIPASTKYTDLDPRRELEQQVANDLKRSLEKRGAKVVHHGSAAAHAPASAPADITVEWTEGRAKHCILVEVAQRNDESEFTSIVAHLDVAVLSNPRTIALYSGRSTSTRMARFIRNENARREASGLAGRVIFLKLNDLQELLAYWSKHPKTQYPLSAIHKVTARWPELSTDLAALAVFQRELFEDWSEKAIQIDSERQRALAIRQERLRKDIVKLENNLRERGITGQRAHKFLIFLFFCALYEDKRGSASRLTKEGFLLYKQNMPASDRDTAFKDRSLDHLFQKEIAADPDIQLSGMLNHYERIELGDDFILSDVIPIFEAYPLSEGGIDFIGAVFEALARRAEKDNRIGQFFTPETAVISTVRLAGLRLDDVVLDPACGTGRFLIHAMQDMLEKSRGMANFEATSRNIKQNQLLGSDIEPWVATIAKMNMYLHGDGKSNIRPANGLALSSYDAFAGRNPARLHGNVDAILMNPPLGDVNFREAGLDLARQGHLGVVVGSVGSAVYQRSLDERANQWSNDLLSVVPHVCQEEVELSALRAKEETHLEKRAVARSSGDPKALKATEKRLADVRAKIAVLQARSSLTYTPSGNSAKGGALFISAGLQYLKDVRDASLPLEWQGGVLATIIDEAVLNTASYEKAREFITRNFYVKAVISLPRNAFEFLAKTTAKTSILVLIKKPDVEVEQKEPVFYAKAEWIGYDSTGVHPRNDLVEVNAAFEAWRVAAQSAYNAAGVFSYARAEKRLKKTSVFGSLAFLYMLSGARAGERLDFSYRRMLDLIQGIDKPVQLGLLLDAVERNPEEKEVYGYAFVSSADGRVRSKGDQDYRYKLTDLRELAEGDILVSGIDAIRGAIGTVSVECAGLVVSKEFFTLRVREEHRTKLLPEYMACILRSHFMREVLEGTITGVSNRTRIESPTVLLSLSIPTPPAIEQQRSVVEKLKQAFSAQDLARQTLKEIESILNADS